MKTILLISAIALSQSVFAKTIQEEAMERIANINQASNLRAVSSGTKMKEMSSLLANKLTGSVVVSVEEAFFAPVVAQPISDGSVYNKLSQSAQYNFKMVNGDVCFINLQNNAQPYSTLERKIELLGKITASSATCIGSQGETVAMTTNDSSGPAIGGKRIISISGFTILNSESVADYSFSTFEVKIK